MKNLRTKFLIVIGVAFLTVAAGVRIRTQTGWRGPLAQGGVSLTERNEGVQLKLVLVDSRDAKRRDYDWWFRVDETTAGTASVEVDCGEYKRLLIWGWDVGVSFDGHRFQMKIPVSQNGDGESGFYRYEYSWVKTAS